MRRPLSFVSRGRRVCGLSILTAILVGFMPAASAGAGEIRIGLAVPLSGPMATQGDAMQRTLERAVQEANAAGGVNGQQIALLVENDACASAVAEGAAGRLIAEGASIVFGHPCSGAAVSAAPIYGKAGALLIAVGPRHPEVTSHNNTLPVPVLRLAGRDDRQGAAAAAWLLLHAPGRRVGIVHDRTGYARQIVREAEAALSLAGASVTEVPIVAAQHTYEAKLAPLKEAGVEAVMFAGFPEEAAIVLSDLKSLGLPLPVLGSDSLATAAFAERAGSAGAVVQVLLPVYGGSQDSNEAPLGTMVRGAFDVWKGAIAETGSIEAAQLSSALRSGASVPTRDLGVLRFDPNGDLDAPAFAAASARGGRWVIEEKK
jgi:branched-chain amino acid transport system substrate-binding protein